MLLKAFLPTHRALLILNRGIMMGASGFRHVTGVQLSINHFCSAAAGDTVLAQAVPVHVGRSTQVWEVKLWKMDPSTREKGPQIAESRVTLLCNLPLPEEHKNAGDALRKYAKL
ncbi:hypothetical protein PR202_gb11356 [Eleusine coracana subsp. coracana]|uniref:Thioesterase domain-containing protein n=1 Tax=Eleusine coracana subsp. coracana TaxID=191504 RepID=A0AAV5ELR9_ELECO|nr:hypothetical protein PR202_gb11356 [Eleusine coracana subsp. coracana]